MQNLNNIFQRELSAIYSPSELQLLFKMVIEDIKESKESFQLLPQTDLSECEEETFYQHLSQLKKEKPIQYVLGNAYFYGSYFKVNQDVLIPRPETEELVYLIIKDQQQKNIKLLDIGTGSGCIAISLQKNLPKAKVDAIDISYKALKIAKENAANNQAAVNFFEADALNLKPSDFAKYDVIVSNPPYIKESEKGMMDGLVTQNEPHLALFVADEEALIFFDKIADFALEALNSQGVLYFEINQNLANETKALLEDKGFNVLLIKDLNDNFRIIKAQLRG